MPRTAGRLLCCAARAPAPLPHRVLFLLRHVSFPLKLQHPAVSYISASSPLPTLIFPLTTPLSPGKIHPSIKPKKVSSLLFSISQIRTVSDATCDLQLLFLYYVFDLHMYCLHRSIRFSAVDCLILVHVAGHVHN